MKSLIDNMVSMIIFVIIVFSIVSFTVVPGLQLMYARQLHAQVINQIQSSYYTVDVSAMNDRLHESFPDWQITSTVINTVSNRQDRLVTLDYTITVPLLNIELQGEIDGYAR